jgi:hypothetical protein
MGPRLQALKFAVVIMGALILVGTTTLVVVVARRSSGAAPPVEAGLPAIIDAALQEPPGTRIIGIAAMQGRLALALQGGGGDRVVLIDPGSGTVVGRISLAK